MDDKKILIIAIILGVVAALINFVYLQRLEGTRITALKVKQRIVAGTKISDDMFTKVTISGDVDKLTSSIIPSKDLAAFKDLPVVETLEPGELLMLKYFRYGQSSGLRYQIRPEERAISIKVQDEGQAVSYLVRPGDKVDVWGIINTQIAAPTPNATPVPNQNTFTATPIIRNACVRAIDSEDLTSNNSKKDSIGRYKAITLIIAEKDTQKIISDLALTAGNIKLTFVGPCE